MKTDTYKPRLFLLSAVGISWVCGFSAVLLQQVLSGPVITIAGYAGTAGNDCSDASFLAFIRTRPGEGGVERICS